MTKKRFFNLRNGIATIAVCLAGSATMFAQETGVKIGNTTWATRNVDDVGTFAENPEIAGMFYQWGSNVAWAATGGIWSNVSETGSEWTSEKCPCPTGWRVPTKAELEILGSGTWTNNYNNTDKAGRVFGEAPNQIFLPAAGFREGDEGMFLGDGSDEHYWSSTLYETNDGRAYFLSLSIEGMIMRYDGRRSGRSVRCVKDETNTAINEVSAGTENSVVTGYFDMLGRQLQTEPKQGFYIIRYSNGTSKKVMR